jgi:hypothetical protein
MARIEPFNSSSSLQQFELIVPNWVTGVFPIAFQEVTTEQVLNQVIPPINNRPPIIQNENPLAIDRYSTWHYIPRFVTIIPQNSD